MKLNWNESNGNNLRTREIRDEAVKLYTGIGGTASGEDGIFSK